MSSNKEEILAGVSLFSKLDRKAIRKLSDLCVPRSYPKDTVILKEGTQGLGLFLITSGGVEIYKGEGEDRLILATLQEGDILGEMALLDDQPRSASARALEPTDCFLLTRDSFNMLMKKDPEIAWSVVPMLAERLRESQNKISQLQDKLDETKPQVVQERVEKVVTVKTEDGHREKREQTKVTVTASGERKEKTTTTTSSTTTENGSEESKDSNPVVTAMRAQYAFMRAGFEGMKGWMMLGDVFWKSLAKESKLTESNDFSEVLTNLPKGSLSAVRSTFEESLKVPGKMLNSFKDNMKRKASIDEE